MPMALRMWSCQRTGVDEICIEHGVLGGSIQTKFELVNTNRSGRSIDEQVLNRMDSRAREKRQQGYKHSIDVAHNESGTNAINLARPMLAHTFDKYHRLEGSYVQYKYDGNRCMIHNDGQKLIAYTRNGKMIHTIDHILDGIDIPAGVTIDGELYHHDLTLQQIVSLIKRKQEGTKSLQYVVYDMIAPVNFIGRFNQLKQYNYSGSVVIAPTWGIEEQGSMKQSRQSAVDNGYEGLIVRLNNTGYEVGKRSKSLLKVKQWQDANFPIIDIKPSVDGWARLICTTGESQFTVSAPGTIEYKKQVLADKENYIGKEVRVEYAYLTKDGVPFHPVATLIIS